MKDERLHPESRWTIIGDVVRRGPANAKFYPARCQCGTERLIVAHKLKNGHTKSCGCGQWDPPQMRFAMSHKINTATGCWDWTGVVLNNGYGTLRVSGRTTMAHRYSFELHKGQIGDGLFVCHRCDNRRCVNPDHLFLGTHVDNMRDMVNKGRSARGDASGARKWPPKNPTQGERNASAKLTEADVIDIRSRHAAGATCAELSRSFGVAAQTISKIVNRRSWKCVLSGAGEEGSR